MKIQSYYYTTIMLSKSHVTKVTTTKQAVAQLNSGQYESALALFEELAANDYKDSKKLFSSFLRFPENKKADSKSRPRRLIVCVYDLKILFVLQRIQIKFAVDIEIFARVKSGKLGNGHLIRRHGARFRFGKLFLVFSALDTP